MAKKIARLRCDSSVDRPSHAGNQSRVRPVETEHSGGDFFGAAAESSARMPSWHVAAQNQPDLFLEQFHGNFWLLLPLYYIMIIMQ
jgi:hypothetical protein